MVSLPSGATLGVDPAPFAESKALYQAVLRQIGGIPYPASKDLTELVKNLFCAGFSSPEVEACLWQCFKRCTYDSGRGPLKIDADTFEPVAAREDYMKVCVEVAKENVTPFGKSLFAEFKAAMSMAEDTQASRQPTTQSSSTADSASPGMPARSGTLSS